MSFHNLTGLLIAEYQTAFTTNRPTDVTGGSAEATLNAKPRGLNYGHPVQSLLHTGSELRTIFI
jgi:hypothetical protein